MKVAILYDPGGEHWDKKDVAQVAENAEDIQGRLKSRGIQATLLPIHLGDFSWIAKARKMDVIFNLCEGLDGHSRYEDYVVGALELVGVPYTGCRPWPVTVCHRKHIANTLMQAAGVPIPRFWLAQGNKIPGDFPLPAIVKPAAEDASLGIDSGAVCTTKRGLRKRVVEQLEQWDEVLVQEYVAGREFNIGFVGKQALPISEICFDGMPEGSWPVLTYSAKWDEGSPEDLGSVPVCPADLPADAAKRLVAAARQAWELLAGGEGYGRVDMRLDARGQAWVLEVNPNPDLSDNAGLARMAKANGWEYAELLQRIVDEALGRSQRKSAAQALATGVHP
jgi:D-alanine-D-alanine ligase